MPEIPIDNSKQADTDLPQDNQVLISNNEESASNLDFIDPVTVGHPIPFPWRSIISRIRRFQFWWLHKTHPGLRIGTYTTVEFRKATFTTTWGEIIIGEGCYIGGGNLEAKLKIGNRVTIVGPNKLGGSGKYSVTVGDDTWIAANVYICPNTHCYKKRSKTISEQLYHGGDITIGSDCWIGINAVISPGITIGNGAIIGANAVVTHDIPDYAIAVGVPARVIGYRE
ncbi:MAG: acyltransferase [Armatimonadota bacterium]